MTILIPKSKTDIYIVKGTLSTSDAHILNIVQLN